MLALLPSRPNILLLIPDRVLLAVMLELRDPACALLAATAVAVGDPKLPSPAVQPASRDAPMIAAVLLLVLTLLLPDAACAALLLGPALGLGEPASTGSRM